MSVDSTPKKKIPRKDDPNFVRNPFTGHFIRRGGKKHRAMLTDGLLGKKRDPNSIIATGSLAELQMMKRKLEESPAFDLKGYILTIRGDQLIKEHNKMTKREIVEHTTRHAIKSAVSNRALMNSGLSDEQLTELLKMVCDAKIVGVELDLEREFNKIMTLNKSSAPPPLPSTPPPSLSPEQRSSVQSPIPGGHRGGGTPSPPSPKKRGRPRRRFHVAKAPVYDTTDFGETTAVESETEFSD